jgi:histone acetyltransferase MCC1
MNGVQQRHFDVIDHLDWIEGGRSNNNTTTQAAATQSSIDPLLGNNNSNTRPNPRTDVSSRKPKNRFQCRMIQPQDREIIQRLHEEWFPVLYQDEFFDELVHGRMIGSGDPLFTRVAIDDQNDAVVGCVVGSFLNAHLLSEVMQNLLVNNLDMHPRVFYIMTLGCVESVRRTGLATSMIEECIAAAEQDVECGVVYLHVKVDNIAAIRMYEKMGFYRVQEIENYYTIDDALHNCFLYARYFHGM